MKFKILQYSQEAFCETVTLELTTTETVTKTFQKITTGDHQIFYYELFEDGTIGSVQNLEPVFVKAKHDNN